MENHYSLVQTLTTGKPARFSANGVRISRERYEDIEHMARMHGRIECLQTRAWPIEGGGTKRKNYSVARW